MASIKRNAFLYAKGSQPATSMRPMVPMSPPMVNAIKQSPKGKLPPGLAKYLAKKKKTKKKGSKK